MNMGQDRHMQMVIGNGGNQFRQYIGNQNRYNAVQNVGNQNPNRNGNVIATRVKGNAIGNNGNQIRCYNCRGLADLDEIKEVNANCILMANLQQASTSGTQTDNALVSDSGESAEVHNYENCYDNEIFNMFTQEEQYTKLLKPIPKPHQVQQNDSNVISKVSSMDQDGGTVDQHLATVEETRAYFESLYNNLEIEVEKLSKKKTTVSSLLKEKKRLKSDFKIREDELLDKQIQLENKIKELDNILVKMGQSIQTMYIFSPKPDSFYHTEKKMALGYQNSFYPKKAQQKQQSLYNGKVLLEKHDPPAVYDSEETLQLAQENNTVKTRRPQPRSNTKNDRVPSASKSSCSKNKEVEVEEHPRNLLLSKNKKHMSSECQNIKLAILNDKFEDVCSMWTVRFGNDHVAAILGFGDLQWGNILITRVYFVEGLGHNLFPVGQFCGSDLKVTFRRNTCFVRYLKGVDLLKGNRTTNLYTIVGIKSLIDAI
nr:integrase, catalytic region, zinc finger, CCHC-type, peptidase aspartic, catalytic [Tanacetum cinerariifolium]